MKTKLQLELAGIAPNICVQTIWEHDEDARWDIQDDSLDPEYFRAWQSEVRTTAIVGGNMVTGSEYLGGTWEKYSDKPWESNPEISGYELQMTEESLIELKRQIVDCPGLVKQCVDAISFCRSELTERYERHHPEHEEK